MVIAIVVWCLYEIHMIRGTKTSRRHRAALLLLTIAVWLLAPMTLPNAQNQGFAAALGDAPAICSVNDTAATTGDDQGDTPSTGGHCPLCIIGGRIDLPAAPLTESAPLSLPSHPWIVMPWASISQVIDHPASSTRHSRAPPRLT